MRSYTKLSLIAFAMTLLPLSMQADKRGDQTIYAFGFSTNLNDTTQFITPIQQLPGATLTKKEGFLEHRSDYGQQFKEHLESLYPGHEVSVVFFSKKKASLQKQLAKLQKELARQKRTKIMEVPATEFQFKPVVVE